MADQFDITMASDLANEAAFRLFTMLSKLPSAKALVEFRDSMSTELPADLTATPLDETILIPDGISRDMCSFYNYDEAHSGRFSLFNAKGATIDADYAINRPDALAFIRDNLTYGTRRDTKE